MLAAKYLILTWLGSLPAFAQPHKQIDVGSLGRADGVSYSVSLCARASKNSAGKPGHAFVAFSRTNREGRTYTAVGHTTHEGPAQAILSYGGYLEPVRGSVEDEKFTAASEECLVINTSAERYSVAWKIVAGFENLTEADFSDDRSVAVSYSLGLTDCVHLMRSVASTFQPHVRVPERRATDLPLVYARRMIDEN